LRSPARAPRVELRLEFDSHDDGSFGKLTASEMAELWARRAILGEDYRGDSGAGALDMTASFSEPETVTLPEVLRACSAGGWLAEGLTRLLFS